ncbi:MAG TPA: TonB-dependent receptor plug domain-containing protein [Opitutaceae bacterium]|nr:TonB-dependent receptor plug domain-containing protein [Opitutaceae bacterium]
MRFIPSRPALLLLILGSLPLALLRAEPVDIDLPAQPADRALLALCKLTKIEVLFSYDDLHRVQSAAVTGRYEPVAALDRLLQGTGFTARPNGHGKYVITPAAPPIGGIKGRLLTPDGTAARGVGVAVPGTPLATVTDARGEFSLAGVPAGPCTLVATGTGYQPLQIVGATVLADRVSVLDPHTMQKAMSEPIPLDPYVVEDKSAWTQPFDSSTTALPPRTATGNVDLRRSMDDALPFTIYTRDQLARSGVVNLNEFLQRELLDSNVVQLPPEQDGSQPLFMAGSTNLSLRGYQDEETVVLVNGRRLPEIVTSGSRTLPPDVNFIPLSLVQQVQVMPVSASALYSGSAVGGVINIVLRPDVDANTTEVTTTYTNALHRYDAPQSYLSLLHCRTLFGGKLRLRLNASITAAEPPTEAELGYHQVRAGIPALDASIHRATPNVRSADGTPLFGPGTASVTSVAPGADGTSGLDAFASRQGVRDLAFFNATGGPANSLDSLDYAYGRRQRRDAYFGSVVYDALPWLQLGFDGTFARTVVNRGLDVMAADLTLHAGSPFNPFTKDVIVSLNETAPLLGPDYSEARLEFSSAVFGLLLKLPADWHASVDTQYAHNFTQYRGLAGADTTRWQQLVDDGGYRPLRDTRVYGPPPAFYDEVLIYRGGRGRFVTIGDYSTIDLTGRISNEALTLPTGPGVVNLGGDYRRNHLGPYADERRYADGSLAVDPADWDGRTLAQYSVFGELQAPLVPTRWLPRWLHGAQADLALRFVAADTARAANFAPTYGLKLDLGGGLALRGSFTTSNRYKTPQMSRSVVVASDNPGDGTVDLHSIFDPRRNETYDVEVNDAVNPAVRSETAVTQTAGLIFQRGKTHRLRATLDFLDTYKNDELVILDETETLHLEALFPDRVRRAPLAPGDPHTVGRVTEVLTGVANLSWRHSQNWNLALDYAWTECLGGALTLYGRLNYFQKYDLQVGPDSAVIPELRHPDGATSSLLKYRANLGAGWSNRSWGLGVDGHYFHSRILPADEWAGQGHDRIRPFWQCDAYVQSDLGRWLPWPSTHYGLRAQLRINNVLDAPFPKYVNDPSGAGVQPYGDWRGRTYSLSLTATF